MTSITPATFNTPHFKWNDPFVTIRTSDSTSTQEPPAPTETSVSLLSGDPTWHQKDLMWRGKLGELIVHDYLAIKPGDYKGTKKYFLTKFPANYVFYVRQTTNPKTRKVRFDCYLAGGGHTYRSPNEFVFHAAWLMAGAVPGDCSCVYCDPSNPGQKGRSKSIEENRLLVRQKIRNFKNAGIKIARAPNALNRKAFLRFGSTRGDRRVSFEGNEEENEIDEETDTNSSVSHDSVERLVDEEADQDMEE